MIPHEVEQVRALIHKAFDYGTEAVFETLAQQCEQFATQYTSSIKYDWNKLAFHVRKSVEMFFKPDGGPK